MSVIRLMLALLIVLSVQPGQGGATAFADEARVHHVAAPVPGRGKGDSCVAPTDWMRRNHMSVLKHQRDDTVHEGVRTNKFSLKGCVDCHAVPGTDGRAVAVDNPKHFCRTCHDYAAVSIDCFECHASRPGKAGNGAAMPEGTAGADEAQALSRYVEERAR